MAARPRCDDVPLQRLEELKMARFESRTGNMYMTDLGRIASHFYVRCASINTINEKLKPAMTYAEIFDLIGSCSEFESMQARPLPDLPGCDASCSLGGPAARACVACDRAACSSQDI